MNHLPKNLSATLAAAMVSLFALSSVQAEKLTFLPIRGNQTTVSVEGTSNVRDWDAQSNSIKGLIEIDSSDFWGESGIIPGKLPLSKEAGINATVRFESAALKNDNRRLTSNLHDYLDADTHPYIEFELESITWTESNDAEEEVDSFTTDASGSLTVSGDSKQITFPVQWTREGNHLSLKGNTELKMSDFGIDPPTMMFGALRTVDEFTVDFNWVLEPKTSTSP